MADHTLAPCPFCGGEAEIERVGDARKSTIYSCTNCGCSLETGEQFNHGAAWNRRSPPAAVPDGWRRLLLAAKILYQHSEACVTNHRDRNIKVFGLPGWLADCKKDIESAQESLSAAPAAPNGWQPIETAPKDGTEFLGFGGGVEGVQVIQVVRWCERVGCWETPEARDIAGPPTGCPFRTPLRRHTIEAQNDDL